MSEPAEAPAGSSTQPKPTVPDYSGEELRVGSLIAASRKKNHNHDVLQKKSQKVTMVVRKPRIVRIAASSRQEGGLLDRLKIPRTTLNAEKLFPVTVKERAVLPVDMSLLKEEEPATASTVEIKEEPEDNPNQFADQFNSEDDQDVKGAIKTEVEDDHELFSRNPHSNPERPTSSSQRHQPSSSSTLNRPPFLLNRNGMYTHAETVRRIPPKPPMKVPPVDKFWERTYRHTLRKCTEAVKESVLRNDRPSFVDFDMIFVMAEFLKPAMTQLDAMDSGETTVSAEQIEEASVSMVEASKALMDRVAKQERDKYPREFVPIVMLARAFASFADKFTRVVTKKNAARNEMPSVRRANGNLPVDTAGNSSGSNDAPQSTSTSTSIKQPVLRRNSMDEIPNQTVKQVQKRKQMDLYQGDAMAEGVRRVVQKRFKSKQPEVETVEPAPFRRCRYCQSEHLNEKMLSIHVRQVHYDKWKQFAPIPCTKLPHCDYRAVTQAEMTEHCVSGHRQQYKEWMEQKRVFFKDDCCPFCDTLLYNVAHLHDHLDKFHPKAAMAAFNKNLAFIGCSECTYSAFFACDVHNHWRPKGACRGSICIRELPYHIRVADEIGVQDGRFSRKPPFVGPAHAKLITLRPLGVPRPFLSADRFKQVMLTKKRVQVGLTSQQRLAPNYLQSTTEPPEEQPLLGYNSVLSSTSTSSIFRK